MKILFVNNFRNRGGGEEFLRDLLPGLAAKGITVGLLCRPGTPLAEMFADSAVTVHALDRSGIRALTSIWKIAGIIRQQGYQIVAIQRGHDILQAWLGAMLSAVRPKLTYTPQVPEFLRSRFLLRRMDAITTISRYIRDLLGKFDRRLEQKISIIYYGIDLSRFAAASAPKGLLRARLGLAPATPIIGTVGDLWKNQIEFLDALVEIRRALPDAKFALVASRNKIGQVEEFDRRVDELGLRDAVVWAGRLSKDEMVSFYSDIDIAVTTHRNEGFGIWILEALAMGKPVVAYNAGGVRDSLEGCPGGVLVDGGAGEMAQTIIQILQSDTHRTALAKEGLAWVAGRFHRDRMIDDYRNFFHSLR